MNKSTPTPWVETGKSKNADGSVTFDIAQERNNGWLFIAECAIEEDAKLICRVVNLHEELVGALKTCLHFCNPLQQEAISKGRAALKKAINNEN